jgi:hypothetical protein
LFSIGTLDDVELSFGQVLDLVPLEIAITLDSVKSLALMDPSREDISVLLSTCGVHLKMPEDDDDWDGDSDRENVEFIIRTINGAPALISAVAAFRALLGKKHVPVKPLTSDVIQTLDFFLEGLANLKTLPTKKMKKTKVRDQV